MTVQALISEIETLPKEYLEEVSNYIAFLRHKVQIAPVETIVFTDLKAGYRAMSEDNEYEKEAQELVNECFGDT